MYPTAQGKRDEQDHTFHRTNCLIAHLTTVVAVIADYYRRGILEHAHRRDKADTVFGKVARRFRRIPLEFHRWYLYTLSGDKIIRSPETASVSRPCDAL